MFIVTASEMAALDRATIEEIGIPGIVLMENAARGAAAFYLEVVPDLLTRRITVLAGSGNNAGDGFVLARLFKNQGADVRVVCLRPPENLQGDALTNFRILDKLCIPVRTWEEQGDFDTQWNAVRESGAVIDAILGTGLKSEVRGLYRQVVEAANALPVPILAVDIPSGLDASTGKPLGTAIRATATATFGFLKIGQVVEPGCDYVGRLKVIDIGIPPTLPEKHDIRRRWLTDESLSAWVEPRPGGTHKGSAGHVAVLSGSVGKTGAATLICLGAGRVGAGLVTLFIPASLNPILEVKLTEAMTYPIPETPEQTPASAALPEILEFAGDKQALAAGPGISLHPDTHRLVEGLIAHAPCPMVLDADAVTIVSRTPDLLKKARQPLVLTPHPGEMARLIGGTVQTVQENRIEVASEFSRKYGVTLVLKGFRTVVAAPDGRLAVNSSGNPAMAGGGMGDTLTGMIAGFLGQGYEPYRAACLGVYIHGAAADRRFGGVATRGMPASDLLDDVPEVIGRLERLRSRS
ncbi:MAG TPA: NAD(P)H-hydrate dehydratase [Syntrophobacter fumaroxidans]|nr:NAD(P)H-hydrate dehydratase [Syntrophobacter fumaroxidans]